MYIYTYIYILVSPFNACNWTFKRGKPAGQRGRQRLQQKFRKCWSKCWLTFQPLFPELSFAAKTNQ